MLNDRCPPVLGLGALHKVRENPRVKATLNHWTSMTKTMGPYMDGLIEAGQEAMAAIDVELGKH